MKDLNLEDADKLFDSTSESSDNYISERDTDSDSSYRPSARERLFRIADLPNVSKPSSEQICDSTCDSTTSRNTTPSYVPSDLEQMMNPVQVKIKKKSLLLLAKKRRKKGL